MSDSEKIKKYESAKNVLEKNGMEIHNWGKFTIRKVGDTGNADFIFDSIDELYGFMKGYVHGKYGTTDRNK